MSIRVQFDSINFQASLTMLKSWFMWFTTVCLLISFMASWSQWLRGSWNIRNGKSMWLAHYRERVETASLKETGILTDLWECFWQFYDIYCAVFLHHFAISYKILLDFIQKQGYFAAILPSLANWFHFKYRQERIKRIRHTHPMAWGTISNFKQIHEQDARDWKRFLRLQVLSISEFVFPLPKAVRDLLTIKENDATHQRCHFN